MSADALISKLDKCKRTGNGRWLACCPAHEDRSPSLSVAETDDGRVLVHCFAGCSVENVIGAVGVGFDELFPQKPIEHAPAVRRPYAAADVLEALATEMQVVTLIACDLHSKKTVSEEDYARLWLAQGRIDEARRLALG